MVTQRVISEGTRLEAMDKEDSIAVIRSSRPYRGNFGRGRGKRGRGGNYRTTNQQVNQAQESKEEKAAVIICYNCQRKNHIAKNCWKPGGGAYKKPNKDKSSGPSNQVKSFESRPSNNMSVGTSYRWSNTHSNPTLESNYRSRGHSKPYKNRGSGRNRDMREGYDIELEWSRGDVHEDFCNDYPDYCYIVTEEQVRQYYNLTNKDWILDSGASCHIIGNIDYFTKSWEVDDTVTPVGGKKLNITRRGDVYLSVQDGKAYSN